MRFKNRIPTENGRRCVKVINFIYIAAATVSFLAGGVLGVFLMCVIILAKEGDR